MDDSKLFIVGANGQLGTELRKRYPGAQYADVNELDITNGKSIEKFDWKGIEVILNAAAYTNVDGAETQEGRITAWAVNAEAVANLVRVCHQHDMTLVHISSDYVFDGNKVPHKEDEPFSPLSVYGASKAAGDLAVAGLSKHYILRTSWVVGKGNNFVKTMKELAEKGVKPTVVADQIGRLTFAEDLAKAIDHLLTTNQEYGTYNLTNDGPIVSWANIAKRTYEQTGHSPEDVTGVSTEEYFAGKDNIAPRPLQSELDLSKIKATGFTPRDWQEAFDEYIAELTS